MTWRFTNQIAWRQTRFKWMNENKKLSRTGELQGYIWASESNKLPNPTIYQASLPIITFKISKNLLVQYFS